MAYISRTRGTAGFFLHMLEYWLWREEPARFRSALRLLLARRKDTDMHRVDNHDPINQVRGLGGDAVAEGTSPVMPDQNTQAFLVVSRAKVPAFQLHHTLNDGIQDIFCTIVVQAVATPIAGQVESHQFRLALLEAFGCEKA